MDKHLFFICPTDCLEVVINNSFAEDTYFCTSLANSISFNKDTIGYIKDMIEYKSIKKITFVLSDENELIQNAFLSKDFMTVSSLNKIKKDIVFQRYRFGFLTNNNEKASFLVSSYYLIKKINQLNKDLSTLWFLNQITIDAKIYNKHEKTFVSIIPSSFLSNCFNLN